MTSPDAKTIPLIRLFQWSVRRELWENRSLYAVPLVAAGVSLIAMLFRFNHLPDLLRGLSDLTPDQQRARILMPFTLLCAMIMLAAFLAAAFYSVDALHGERRDRSILFWKSLPVSDRLTVLAKASIPMAIQPAITFAIVVGAQASLLLLASGYLLLNGVAVGPVWAQLPLVEGPVSLLYAVIVTALWYAPLYGWLLLVSCWARRATMLWAVLTPLALCLAEKIAFGSVFLYSMLKDRFNGDMTLAFSGETQGAIPLGGWSGLTPGHFLTSPGLWGGLALTILLLAAAIRLRRYRQPL